MAEQLCSKSFLSRALNLSSFPVLLLLLVQNVVIHVLFLLVLCFFIPQLSFQFPSRAQCRARLAGRRTRPLTDMPALLPLK